MIDLSKDEDLALPPTRISWLAGLAGGQKTLSRLRSSREGWLVTSVARAKSNQVFLSVGNVNNVALESDGLKKLYM